MGLFSPEPAAACSSDAPLPSSEKGKTATPKVATASPNWCRRPSLIRKTSLEGKLHRAHAVTAEDQADSDEHRKILQALANQGEAVEASRLSETKLPGCNVIAAPAGECGSGAAVNTDRRSATTRATTFRKSLMSNHPSVDKLMNGGSSGTAATRPC